VHSEKSISIFGPIRLSGRLLPGSRATKKPPLPSQSRLHDANGPLASCLTWLQADRPNHHGTVAAVLGLADAFVNAQSFHLELPALDIPGHGLYFRCGFRVEALSTDLAI
jgi:hypothetical protein